MGLETAVYINGLVITNPLGSDDRSTADDHLRLIKTTIKNTFPQLTGAVTATQAELNLLDGATLSTAELNKLTGLTATTAELNKLTGVLATTAEINYLQGVTSAIQTQIDAIVIPGQYHFSATLSTTYVLTTSNVELPFATELLDPQGDYDNTTYRYTPSSAGVYHVIFDGRVIDTSANGIEWIVRIQKNGSVVAFNIVESAVADSGNDRPMSVHAFVSMNGTTDYLSIGSETLSATKPGTIGWTSGGAHPLFAAYKISD